MNGIMKKIKTKTKMSKESIVIIQHNRLKKYNYCSYDAYLKNWSKFNWKLLYKVIKPKQKDE